MKRVFTVLHVLGLLLVVFSLAFLLPILVALLDGDRPEMLDFMVAMVLTAGLGALVAMLTRAYKQELSIRHGYLLVTGAWVIMPVFAVIPLLLILPGLSFTDAYFETMSGLTTTGSTVLVGLDNLPPELNIWRHELNWLGGLGIIVLAVAILPLLGIGGRQLYKAETPGPMKDSSLTPRISDTARNLWVAYVAITLVCIVVLKWAGMNWLDAVCHSFSAMGLGGFSTHDASIGYYNSPLIEFALIVFMLIAVVNFTTHFMAYREQSLKVYRKDPEAFATLGVILGSCVAIAFYLWWTDVYTGFWTALRHASFNLVSIATSSGYASVDYAQWPMFAPLWMMLLTATVASAGSTGGGIKMIRTMILVKQGGREFRKMLHPTIVNPMKIGGQVIENHIVFAVLGFIFLYFMSITILTFVELISGLDFITAFTAILASINNCGPGLGQVGPASNYQGLNDFQTWICTFAMLVGRLEIFTVLILFSPHFWRR
ncbi:MAG: TrkH family potassium uptake protein [Nitrosomonadales bacterium]|nr:TrkH family potassium uptake protein [Nitrosomonadales bacterium]